MLPKKIGIALFVYNRPSHLRRVLIALEDYKIKHANIFIDGPRNEKDKICQKEILFMLNTNTKIKFTIKKYKVNKGLAISIENGMKIMSNKYSSFIILEDDCIPRMQFFQFMQKSLKQYEKDNDVQGICGYQLPEIHMKNSKILYSIALKNFMPWGWATWSKKYKNYLSFKKNNHNNKKNSKIINKILSIKINKQKIWTLNFIRYCFFCNKFFIYPNKSQVKNIGFDGSGINSSFSFKFNTFYTFSKKINIVKDIKIDIKKSNLQEKILLKRLPLFY
tara:strand:+ start:571 stop:1401 length:831 start_codon:yes stop_codon:yes gene_type:complete